MADPGASAASIGPTFWEDGELGYRHSLTAFAQGPLVLDEPYRLAHLPLVAPDHPRVIARQEGRAYEMGVHPPVFSLVLPIDGALLAASEPFQKLDAEMRAAAFAPKIAWDILPQRSDRLHATLCGTLSTGDAPVISDDARRALARIEPFAVDLRGPFSGNVNRGRIYLRVYPEKRDGLNPIHEVQAAFERPPGDLYLVGLYNLTDDLDASETAALAEIIARWWDVSLLRFMVTDLWLLGARDDLVLDSQITETLSLRADERSSPEALQP
jgi:hypothetical protein